MITHVKKLPLEPHIEDFKNDASELLDACRAGDRDAVGRVQTFHPAAATLLAGDTIASGFDAATARRVVAREYGFEQWTDLETHLEELGRAGSLVPAFEAAADAIGTGDVTTLMALIRERPELVRARSTREHHGTPLHYVGANGIEFYRQKSPPNATAVAALLVEAGAEVDAVARMYGSAATLGLVATSAHPKLAGVQLPVLGVLLDAGAAIDGPAGTWNPLVAALRNGCGDAADFLATRGARLDLEGAAGVGRLDMVRSLFENSHPKGDATAEQATRGFSWACRYAKTEVVDFMLRNGIDSAALIAGMHWAAAGGDLATLRLFINRSAPLEALSEWGGTVLATAVWCAEHNQTGKDYMPIIASLIDAGADLDAEPDLRRQAEAALDTSITARERHSNAVDT
jgi:hypothetical protein